MIIKMIIYNIKFIKAETEWIILTLKQTRILLIFSHKKKDSMTKMISRTDKFESSRIYKLEKIVKKI